MPKSSSHFLKDLLARDPKTLLRTILGALLVLNLIAAALVMFPPGGSAEDLDQQLATLQAQALRSRKTLETTRAHVAAVENGRGQGDQFLTNYFLGRRAAYSTLLDELGQAARQSQIKAREHSFTTEPIEGSDTLSMMTITANYEGTYKDLLNFVHQIDQSPRLMIIESLNAAPQTGSGMLTVNMKIDTFVRETGE